MRLNVGAGSGATLFPDSAATGNASNGGSAGRPDRCPGGVHGEHEDLPIAAATGFFACESRTGLQIRTGVERFDSESLDRDPTEGDESNDDQVRFCFHFGTSWPSGALVLDRSEDSESIDVNHPVLGHLDFDAAEQHCPSHDGGWVIDFDLTEINRHRGTPTSEQSGCEVLFGPTENPDEIEVVGRD